MPKQHALESSSQIWIQNFWWRCSSSSTLFHSREDKEGATRLKRLKINQPPSPAAARSASTCFHKVKPPHHLYIIIGLSWWPRVVAYVDGRTVGRGRHRRRSVGRNRGLTRRREHGLRQRTDWHAGTSKAGQTDMQADGLADGPNARFWLISVQKWTSQVPMRLRPLLSADHTTPWLIPSIHPMMW